MRHGRELLIEASGDSSRYWRDVWDYRELLGIFAWRDILVRYKQTVLGVAWAVLQPLVTMLAFTIVFGRLAKLPSQGVPYHVLVLAGLLPWQLFSQAFSSAANSLVGQGNMISKVYFPRVIVPAAAIVTSLVDFLIATLLFLILAITAGVLPTERVVVLPLFLLLAIATALGGGLLCAALTVKYRDFRFIVPFVLQVGLYISPVGFDASVVPERWRFVYSLNPLVSIIDGFRWCLLPGNRILDWNGVAVGSAVIIVLLVVGSRYFLSTERDFADVV